MEDGLTVHFSKPEEHEDDAGYNESYIELENILLNNQTHFIDLILNNCDLYV